MQASRILDINHTEASHRRKSNNNNRKRKTPDHPNCDDGDGTNSEMNHTNATYVVKRFRNDAVTATIDVDADQRHQSDSGDEMRGSNSSQGTDSSVRTNGMRSIDSNEAFKQGYVVVIPSRQTLINRPPLFICNFQ